ncbi:MAG: DUF2339 domain-containing protein, partial [Mesorhizobium sp.]
IFVGLSALGLSVDPAFIVAGDALAGAALLAAMLAVALYQPRALPLLHAAGLVTAMIYLGIIPPTSIGSEFIGGSLGVDGQPVVVSDQLTRNIGVGLGLLFIAAGFWAARRWVATARIRSASWAAWGVIAPLVVLTALWFTFGNLDRDFLYAAVAALLVVAFAAGGEWI